MIYKNLSRDEILSAYYFAIKKRKEGLGQRNISKIIKEEFGKEINESTISNWIYHGKVPFSNEKTQFKSLPKPKKEDIYDAIDSAKEELLRQIKSNKEKKQTLFKRGSLSIKKMLKGISDRNPFNSKY